MQGIHTYWLIIFVLLISPDQSNANQSKTTVLSSQQELKALIDGQIRESYEFYGLASYFNQLHYFSFSNTQLQKIDAENAQVQLNLDTWLLVVGRFNVLVLQSNNQSISIQEGEIQLHGTSEQNMQSQVISKPEVGQINQALDALRYQHLYAPLAELAKAFEWVLRSIGQSINWGVAIIVFAVLIKILLLPINILTVRSQRKVSLVQSTLIPELGEIKAKYDGEEAHKKIMAAHKNHGVSPFFTMKPLISTLVQIPVLIAIFNVLGEMPELKNASFLWVDDLAYPDVLAQFSTGISLLGDKVSLLPVLMTLIALLSSYAYKDLHLPTQAANAQKKKLLFMALAFFVLFYPFPASMVLYWAMTNLLQFIQQKVMEK